MNKDPYRMFSFTLVCEPVFNDHLCNICVTKCGSMEDFRVCVGSSSFNIHNECLEKLPEYIRELRQHHDKKRLEYEQNKKPN